MDFKIIWSNFAGKQLDKIFEYYAKNISEQTAKKIVKNVLLQTEKLNKTPFIGQIEVLLQNRKPRSSKSPDFEALRSSNHE